MTEVFVSTDVETDGPIPGAHSMLSLGSAAFWGDELITTFECNFETLPEAVGHPVTMQWWERYPEAWGISRKNLRRPQEGIQDYVTWLASLPGIPVFVGYPAAFDFMFVYYYLIRFFGSSPFAHSALDIKSYAMAVLKTEYRLSNKKKIETFLSTTHSHRHTALEDAIQQGVLFCKLHQYNLTRC